MSTLGPQAVPGPAEAPFDPWNFRTDVAVELSGATLAGYSVEAADGSIGKVTGYGLDPDYSYLVVRTGRILGRQVLLPAGVVNHVDHSERTAYLDRSREEVKGAPQVPAEACRDDRRDRVADYFARTHQPH